MIARQRLDSLQPASTLLGIGACVAAAMAASLAGTGGAPGVSSALAPAPAKAPAAYGSALAKSSEAFVENRGQWDAQAQFLARSPGVDVWVTEAGVVYDFFRVEGLGSGVRGSQNGVAGVNALERGGLKPALPKRKGHVVRMEFVGGRPSPVRGENLLEGRYNYFLGNDESKWASNVPFYSEARSERIYDGIQARWYFDQGKPRYDLVVAPGADPSKIAMRFDGAQGMSGGKTLKLGTSLGDVEHKGLFAYQKVGDATKQVPASFAVRGNVARFELGDYDKTKPLVIDPLVWSTYLGGAGGDVSYATKIDGNGAVVTCGTTNSPTFPVTAGAFEETLNGDDAFVTKLAPDGATLIYSTFLGGDGSDAAHALALDAQSNAYVCGLTLSDNFPTTAGSFDESYNGNTESFVTKLDASGASLVYSAYLGGSGNDFANAIDIDSQGRALVGGSTFSTDYPTTAGAFDETANGGTDGVLAKVSADGASLLYATYLGGSGNDSVTGVNLDATSRATVCGKTDSANFPTTAGAFDETYNGTSDAFAARLSANGASLRYGTFIGGSLNDGARAIDVDLLGNALVCGDTISTDFPTTAGAFDRTHNGDADAFVTRVNPTGSKLSSSTYLGGDATDFAKGAALDKWGNAVVCGITDSTDFPMTPNSDDPSHNGSFDAYVAKLPENGSTVLYGSFVGGSGNDFCHGLALDADSNGALCGETDSADFPTTAGAFDTTYGTNFDAFVTRIRVAPALLSASSSSKVVGGFAGVLTVRLNQPASPGGTTVTLSTDTPGKVFPPLTTNVREGAFSRKVGVATETVKADTPVQLFAACNGVTQAIAVVLKPGGLLSLKLSQASLISGGSGSGIVKLSGASPVSGRLISLESSNALALFVNPSVNIPSGQSGAFFPMFAGSVAVSTPVAVKAKLGTTTKMVTLTVTP